VRHGVLIGALFALLVPVALAANGEPQKKLTKAGQAHARAASLTAADVGPGWKAEPKKQGKDNSDPRCSYYDPDQSDLIEIGDYDSPDFSLANGSFVSSSTGVFRSARMARTAYARVATPSMPRCFAELFRKEVDKKPNKLTILSIGRRAFPGYGDRSDAFRISASLRTPQATVPFTIDIFTLNRGATDVAIICLGIGRALPAAFEQSLVRRLAARA
jgi:hypothetical protein